MKKQTLSIIKIIAFLCIIHSATGYASPILFHSGRQNILTVTPESLHFEKGVSGETVSLKYNSFDDNGLPGYWDVQGDFSPGCHNILTEYGGGIVTNNAPGTAQNWFKISDTLEYSIENTYYGITPVRNELALDMKQSANYTLCSNGTSNPARPVYHPFINTTTVTFRLTKNVIDSNTYIPPLVLGEFYLGYYTSEVPVTSFLSFIRSHRPNIVFKINAGTIVIPTPRCTITPSEIVFSFGDISPSKINKLKTTKNLLITCSGDTTFDMKVNSSEAKFSSDGVYINTNNPEIMTRITSDREPTNTGKFTNYEAQTNKTLVIPINAELISSTEPSPGNINGNAWLTFNYK
ncbi:hypothetical protein ACK1MN_003751 [Salmonella enterica]|nr:hypothetical protein [Salmonella enterica]EJF5594672.1 hypothetical protein [Salmonella enterica]EJF5825837.1 hypothetical protein [Salmonella enterica]EJF5844549.1 hypothetical protein [Salmonella enterica]EJF5917026.1 hypothetical protein [Salmonella enterica]